MNADNFKMKLKDLETRICSMALIHEKLYKNDRISKLNVSEYLTELADYILESYAATSTKLHFNIKVENVEYGIDALIPLGLILNETISNSIKHAFKDDVEGEITIHLSNTEESTFLLIADNGVGSDISTDQLKEKSLGLELIFDLTDQLDGALELQKENGFTYKFNFPRLK
jgi:two-component sensor histidine kinase